MALIPSVGTGQIITPTWGNGIRDRTIQYFATVAEAKSTWSNAPDGAFAYAADEDTLLVMQGTTWRWWHKTFPTAAGHTTYLAWNTPTYNVGSCLSTLSINGRSLTLAFQAVLTTPVTSSTAVIATMTVGHRSTIRLDAPLGCHHATGAGSGRLANSTDGTITGFWATGDNPGTVTATTATVLYSVADLVPVP